MHDKHLPFTKINQFEVMATSADHLKFIELIQKLKHLPRRGWVLRNVNNHESIAGHMYSMAMMTFLLDDPNIDRIKCMQMALVHDLAESIVGDITPEDRIPIEKKHQMEDEAMKEIVTYLGKELGGRVYSLYKEYEAKETVEAKFVKDLDRFDLVACSDFYEKRDEAPGKLQEFFDVTEGNLEHPLVKGLMDKLVGQRKENGGL